MKHARWLMMLALALLVASCTGRPRKAGTNDGERGLFGAFPKSAGKLIEIDLTAGVPEALEAGLFPLPPERTYFGLVRALQKAATDERLSGVLVLMGATELGFSRAEEVGRLLAGVRAKGVPVVCHAHQLSNSTVWLAAAGCDRIWLSPAGGVDSVGMAAQVLYFRGALDRLKVRADFIAIGDYKSAVESFLRDGPSDEAREDLTKTFGSMRRSWLEGMKGARSGGRVVKSLETGPWGPKEAKARGLVDEIGYESDALADARGRSGASEAKGAFGPSASGGDLDIGELLRILAGTEAGGGRPHVALVSAVGAIGMASGGGLFDSGGISEKALGKTLERLTKDESVKAVVLRIDSPGGSALASDLLWKRLRLLREQKPLVVSVGDMAASGGYYMACAANEIVAERTSIVGSIGVFGGKLTFDEGLAEVGVNAVTFPASSAPGAAARAAYLSPFVPWDDATRQRVRASMKSVYDLFLERVALGRSMEIPKVHQIAQGKIWSGEQGKKNGLVDLLGGLELAVARARELGKLDADAPIVVEGTGETLLELLMVGEGASRAEVETALVRLHQRHARFVDLVPAELRPYVGTLNPLMQGEHTLAALPFGLVVR
jgi:protease-4